MKDINNRTGFFAREYITFMGTGKEFMTQETKEMGTVNHQASEDGQLDLFTDLLAREDANTVKFKLLDKRAKLPAYQTKGAAGFDISCILDEPITIRPECMQKVRTGLAVEIPEGTELQVRPRSGLAFKNGITIINSPCTIDSDFRGEVILMLINHSGVSFVINNGDRIAQGLIKEARQYKIVETNELSETIRNTGGFGSTGTK